MTDTELLDALQKLNDLSGYTGLCILRMSTTGRGWRLHEVSTVDFDEANTSVRQAIEAFVREKE